MLPKLALHNFSVSSAYRSLCGHAEQVLVERDGDNEAEQHMSALEPGSTLSVSQPLGRGYVPKASSECICGGEAMWM
jgi:ferredoxin-NADP reductase